MDVFVKTKALPSCLIEMPAEGEVARGAPQHHDEVPAIRETGVQRQVREQACGVLARGLEAIASGYSLRFPDDLENLEAQFEVYDALYAWCRLDVAKR